MPQKSKLHLKKSTVANLANLSPDEQLHVNAGGFDTRVCPVDPMTDSYAPKTCGGECTHILTFYCWMSYWC